MTDHEILADLQDLLSDFQGHTYDDPINADTMFFGDLGYSSIDAVVLGETLEQRFDTKLSFGPFLSQLSAQGAQDISVGQLVEFLQSQNV